jgi:ferritin-like metal-binding protein YciE
MTTEDKKVIITIDDVDYTEDQLTDAQKMMINHINSLQQKIGSNEFNLDQLKVGKDAFVQMLKASLEEEEAVEETVQ